MLAVCGFRNFVTSKQITLTARLASFVVSAKAQTLAYDKIKDVLTEQETAVYKRGRNAKVGHNPKSASQGEYHIATGVEALFGYLYLTEQDDRIKELFGIITE